MHRRVVVRIRNPSGEVTPPAVWRRTNASWTASSASATLPSIRYATDIIRGRSLSRIAGSTVISPSLLPLFREDDVLDVCGVQHHGQDARLGLLARVPRYPVQATGRLVEGVARLENLGRLVVDGPLVLALQNVPERRAGVAVRRLRLARPEGHLDRRGLRLLPVHLLSDVAGGQHLDRLVLLAVPGRGHPADPQPEADRE